MKRDDLQGLRGLAIVAVLAFHFFPKQFPNGYIGVDMFFVLSGFLMTMIFGSKPINLESVHLFYYRRAKRILPLYISIIFIGSIFVFLAFPNTFVPMNMDSAWNSIFLYHNMAQHSDNNMYFQMLNQAEDIFTHTWSLCVEMQFYVLAPAIFFLLSFCTSAWMSVFFHLVIIITSLGNHLLSTEQVAFNSVFCRVWQFLIGSAVYFLSAELIELDTKVHKYTEVLLEEKLSELSDEENEDEIIPKPRRNLSRAPIYLLLCTSLTLLVALSFSIWTIPSSTLRVTSTLLASLVILAGTLCETNPLQTRPIVYVGDISYSLYLVHWPIYVYVKHYYENQFVVYLLAIAISVLLAIILSETFEKWYLKLGKKEVYWMLAGLYMAVIMVVVHKTEISAFVDEFRYGHENNLAEKVHSSFENVTLEQAIVLNKKWAREEYKNLIIANCFPNKTEHGFCEFNKTELHGDMDLYLVGNSLTPNLGSLVFKTFGNHARNIYKFSGSYCEVLAVANEGRCRKTHDLYLQKVSEKVPDVLFILDRPDKLRKQLKGPIEKDGIFKEALETLKKYELNVKKKIFILGQYTPPKSPSLTKFSQMLQDGKNVTQSTFEVDFSYLNGLRRQEELVKKCSKCELIRISDILFNGNQTKSFDEETKLGYYYDGLHITPFAQNLLQPLFQNVSDSFH